MEADHIAALLAEYERSNLGAATSGSGVPKDPALCAPAAETWAGEAYESTAPPGAAAAFHKFAKRLRRAPQQCVRRDPGEAPAPAAQSQAKPSSAETARTVVDIVSHGTLSTLSEDGSPLGTYASYVLDERGQPILRLRAEAVHTGNLLRNPRCSLFVQPEDMPARLLARATLIGQVEPLGVEDAAEAAERHAQLFFGGVAVDAVQPSDQYYRLALDSCFFVAGMGASCCAESISAAEYMAAEPDGLREETAALVAELNSARVEDVLRIAGFAMGAGMERLEGAELLWVDRLGLYLLAAVRGEGAQVVRVTFAREVLDERDARSTLTMLAQLAWERERNYVPIVPQIPDPVGK
ncbi:hypothetical protein WJX81_006878 [Elliptochloris bilobata]|uniref:DUF2470 domain-containing protein n=1 Tax=Elliptochloris bilobata TaxID=381761 RepID=A0AAW1RQD8_9CHLO